MVGHGGSSAGSYLADPTSPIPSHCASIVVTSTVRVKSAQLLPRDMLIIIYQLLTSRSLLTTLQTIFFPTVPLPPWNSPSLYSPCQCSVQSHLPKTEHSPKAEQPRPSESSPTDPSDCPPYHYCQITVLAHPSHLNDHFAQGSAV